MADLDRVAVRVSDGLRNTLSTVSKLALGIAAGTFLVGLATFATGWWVSDGSPAWIVIGGAICFIPTAAALLAWFYVRCTVNVAPALLDNVRTVLNESRSKQSGAPADVLIDYDTGRDSDHHRQVVRAPPCRPAEPPTRLAGAVLQRAGRHRDSSTGGHRPARHPRSRCPRHDPADRRRDRLTRLID